jgi:DNA-binding MarR family transcriptional regulator
MAKPQTVAEFDLQQFFPYLVRVYYRAVSDSVSHIYGSIYDLSVSEWRVMATLGSVRVLSAGEIVEQSSMTKVNVSRAVKSLEKSGLLKRNINNNDKRRVALKLTSRGEKVFCELLPLISALEKDLLHGLTKKEVKLLISMMSKIRGNAELFMQHCENQAH